MNLNLFLYKIASCKGLSCVDQKMLKGLAGWLQVNYITTRCSVAGVTTAAVNMMPSYTSATLIDLKNAKHPIVDLRSDTVSKPTPAMRQAMFDAEVGDDVSGEDPTVNALEERVAKLFNKDKAIFLPTGTMGNAIAVLAHCDKRGCEIIVGDQSHIYLYEQGAPAQLGGVHTRTVKNLPDGTFDLTQLEGSIRSVDVHAPITALVAVENTHNMCGGKVLPLEWLTKLAEITKRYSIPLHMDGARLFNAAVHLGVSVADITRDIDSVQFCFSKGLGCPAGSMLVGSELLITKARRLRKVMGAGMRQVGVLAAPCNVALDTMIERLAEDHRRALAIAEGIAACGSPSISANIAGCHSNILMVYLDADVMSAPKFCSRLTQVTAEEEAELGEDAVIVRIWPRNNTMVRMVTYWETTDLQVQRVIKKLQFIAKELATA